MNLHAITRFDPDRLTYNVEVPLFAPVFVPERQAYFLERSRAPGKHGAGFSERLETPYPSTEAALAAGQKINGELQRMTRLIVAREVDRLADSMVEANAALEAVRDHLRTTAKPAPVDIMQGVINAQKALSRFRTD